MKNNESMNRRQFLEFLGIGASVYIGSTLLGSHWTEATTEGSLKSKINSLDAWLDKNLSLKPTTEDNLICAPGFSYQTLVHWDEKLSNGVIFGSHNDFLALFPFAKKPNEFILWVNHEYLNPVQIKHLDALKISKRKSKGSQEAKKTPLHEINRDKKWILEKEMPQVGGSLVHIQKQKNGTWNVIHGSSFNRRIDGSTQIPFAKKQLVMGRAYAMGTLGNCAGGVTPWKTVLSCEENYQDFYGESKYTKSLDANGKPVYQKEFVGSSKLAFDWYKHFNNPPEHYGWVVEIEPFTGKAKTLTSLGRFSHEGATCIQSTPQSPTVVYLGDDKEGECFYKFISNSPLSLEEGTLYVANLEKGEWISLDYTSRPEFKERFKDQLDLLTNTREAAAIAGGTRLGRPEDCEVNPFNKGEVLVALTTQEVNGKKWGSILKISEENQDPLSLKFKSESFLLGGESSGIVQPDNLAFDKMGNLWITNDISDDKIGEGEYQPYGNNSLFVIPTQGTNKGKTFRVASAPKGAEMTGPCFTPDGSQLFLSIQHPAVDSQFPLGPDEVSRSTVVVISGPFVKN